MKKKSNKAPKLMQYEAFESKYNKQIENMVEQILDTKKDLCEDNYERYYDEAVEEAVYVLAKEKGISIE
jgi:hypothetical protein